MRRAGSGSVRPPARGTPDVQPIGTNQTVLVAFVTVVERQIVEIEKQNGVINALEREMLRLKATYQTELEDRNFAGVQVIDRNDELCVLYEKSNIQETTLAVSCRGQPPTEKSGEITSPWCLMTHGKAGVMCGDPPCQEA